MQHHRTRLPALALAVSILAFPAAAQTSGAGLAAATPPPGAAAAAPPAAAAAATAPAAAPGYRLGPDDEVKVFIYGQPDLSVTTRVKADGTIRLAMLGAVDVRGKTTAELADAIASGYASGGYLERPSVNVEVSQFVSRSVAVLGNVSEAGNYPLDRPYTVASMLAKAGGANATGANAVILTPADGSGPVRISLADMNAGANRPLGPGDILFVPPAEKVYVYGQVQGPGAFNFVPGQTFRQALALAGGPTLAGSTKRIKVRRAGKEIEGITLDDAVQPEDVLIIREKLF
ncbi:polysaccharide export outer membrane protein [Sphingomonas naasensis]|uniref:Sugar ABC transporter substrate-binding protein n=1 Tax=Sphingomonas naasensis TaxID=1344951 RepID=A0A4S1WXQ0_9SPHN|nr:polysaccharide biosynthesis/export family protein [Sphingomonas naasensis]NIJ19234.1 polysaccharide export outer membrane protein [Sphingomonas naasensis]TGX46416.1 sugar ABC transporter substrate-binding protein [Sphingomonas naasensis]